MVGTQPFAVELLGDMAGAFGSPDAAMKRLRQLAVMDLLKQHKISQGKAAEMLQLHRIDRWQLTAEFDIPVVDMTPRELEDDMNVAIEAARRTKERQKSAE